MITLLNDVQRETEIAGNPYAEVIDVTIDGWATFHTVQHDGSDSDSEQFTVVSPEGVEDEFDSLEAAEAYLETR